MSYIERKKIIDEKKLNRNLKILFIVSVVSIVIFSFYIFSKNYFSKDKEFSDNLFNYIDKEEQFIINNESPYNSLLYINEYRKGHDISYLKKIIEIKGQNKDYKDYAIFLLINEMINKNSLENSEKYVELINNTEIKYYTKGLISEYKNNYNDANLYYSIVSKMENNSFINELSKIKIKK